jgi:hypothetical protein
MTLATRATVAVQQAVADMHYLYVINPILSHHASGNLDTNLAR